MRAIAEIRSQRRRGGHGPDTYFAVQVVPDGVQPLLSPNRKAAKRRGIEIIYCGEGYSGRQQTGRSMYNQAKRKACEVAARINGQQEE